MTDPRWVVGKNLARLEVNDKMACSTKKPVKKTAKKVVAKKVKK